MSAKATILAVALAAALAQPGSGKPEPTVPLPAPAAKAAREFLFAFTRNDRETIAGLLPRKLENLYGPSPFAKMPRLRKPRADTRTGAIDFEGVMSDAGLPRKGTIILRLVEEDSVRKWRVRQLYWYKELPPEAELPDSSPTEADRKQEPEIREAATAFIKAWLDGDCQAMDKLTFHWWEVARGQPKWVVLNGADLVGRPTTLDGLRVDFVAKLKVVKVVPKEVRGNVWLVQEDGEWRVRPLTFNFAF